MTALVDALAALGLEGTISLSGRWLVLNEDGTRVFVVEASRGGGYYSWCEDPAERVVEYYPDASAAILAGLRRAGRHARGAAP
jgi:hypothetical protein